MSVYCPRCGEKMPMVRTPTSARQAMWGGWTCHKCGCEMDKHGKEISGNKNIAHNTQPNFNIPQNNVKVNLQSIVQRVKAATEEVRVPPGVTIKVKRSRNIEHTVEVNWSSFREAGASLGIKDFINLSVRGAIEQQQGRTYQESESMEYEIELNGTESSLYTLVWTDIWREGSVEYFESNKSYTFPIRFRERAELEVVKA